jgi:hypothetical protein
MAESEKIKASDIVENDLFKNTKESADKFSKSLDKLDKSLKSIKDSFTVVLKTQEKILASNIRDAKDIKDKNAALTKSQAARLALIEIEKQQVKLNVEKEKLARQQLQTQKAANKETEAAARAADKQVKATEKLNSLYAQESKRLNDLRKQYKDLVLAGKESEAETKKLLTEITALDKKLKVVDASVGQFQRSVGDYKNAVSEAIAESLSLGGVLGNLVTSFRKVRDAENEANGETKQLSANWKAAAAVGAILLIEIGKKLVEGLKATRQSLQDLSVLTEKAFTGASIKNLSIYLIALRETRPELRAYAKQLQDIANDEGDLNDIVNDNTVSLGVRNKALEESLELSKRKAAILVSEAEANLRVIDAEIALAKDDPIESLLIARQEAANKLSEAQDNLQDQTVIAERRIRQLTNEQIINNIEITRSNKLTANARVNILKAQIADEKIQIEERAKLVTELNNANIETIKSETNELEKAGISRAKFDEATALQDEVQLKNFVRKNLAFIEGTEIETAFFKVVKQAQESQIENNERLLKLEEERIKNAERIFEITIEIQQLERDEKIKIAEEESATRQATLEKFNETILQGEKVFNNKLLKSRKELFNEQVELDDELLKLQNENLDAAQAKEEYDIKQRLLAKEVEQAELLEIEKKYDIKRRELNRDAAVEASQKREKEKDAVKAIELRKTEIVVENLQKVTSALSDEIDKQNEKRIESADKEIEVRESNVDKQRKLAEDGQANQLAFEVAALEKAELRKKEIEEKAAREKEALALVESYEAFLLTRLKEANANPNTAPFLALKDTLLARGVAKGLVGFFAEGVEDLQGAGTKTSDSIPAMLSKGESVLTADATASARGLATAANKGMLDEYLINNWLPKYMMNEKPNDKEVVNTQFLSALAEIKQEIKNKPVQIWSVNEFGELVERRIAGDMSKKVVYKQKYKFH